MGIQKIAATVAIAILVMLPAHASAACETSKRISHLDASCLDAEWYNPPGILIVFNTAWFKVRNLCSSQGTVVAKVDVRAGMDKTLYLGNSELREGAPATTIRGIYCCEDLSDLCSR